MNDLSPSVIEGARSYRDVLSAWVEQKKRIGGGRALVRLLKLSPATVTRVLAGKQELSKEHLYRFCVENTMSFEQTGFMLALWDWELAEDPGLKARLAGEVEIQRKKLFSSRAVTGEEDLSHTAAIYVASRWEVDAVLSALSIPALREPTELARRLALDSTVVLEVLSELERFGLVTKDKSGRYQNKRLHHNIDDKTIGRINIRSWSARAGSRPVVPNAAVHSFNYEAVSVVALSSERAAELKAALRRTFQEVLAGHEPKKDPEVLYCYLIQAFDVLSVR